MLLPFLITSIIVLGAVVSYIYYFAPKFNPVNRAEEFLNDDRIEEAIIEYKKILERQPKNFLVHYKLGNLYYSQGQLDRGIMHFEEVLNIDRYSYEIDKVELLRKLAKAYLHIGDTEKAFIYFYDIVKVYPGDAEALYHVSFISLGQEMFDFAYRNFEKLVKSTKKNFEVMFGAGMASFQNQKVNDAVEYFKDALNYNSQSDIGRLALAFSFQRQRDFKAGLNILQQILDSSDDINALVIAYRLRGILAVQSRKYNLALEIYQKLYELIQVNALDEEEPLILYDLGFVALSAEKSEMAYDYWNQLYQIDKNFRNVQLFITMLRHEMDSNLTENDSGDSILDYMDDWIKDSFSSSFVWQICGLRSENQLDLENIISRKQSSSDNAGQSKQKGASSRKKTSGELLPDFHNIDLENFKIISNRVLQKLGYDVDEILPTYRDHDGVDFIAHPVGEKIKVLVWVRRWQGANIGEIPLRNFAQAINDAKAKKGLLLTTSDLTESGESALSELKKIEVIYPDKFNSLLQGLI